MDITHNLYRCDTVENKINRLAIIFIFTIVVLIHCTDAVLDILLRPLIHVHSLLVYHFLMHSTFYDTQALHTFDIQL